MDNDRELVYCQEDVVKKNIFFWLTIIVLSLLVLPVSADDDKDSDAQPRYEGRVAQTLSTKLEILNKHK